MSAVARLWLRAPLWRWAVVIAGTATILAVLYPVQRQVPVRHVASHYTPLTPASVLGPGVKDVLSVLDRQIPLPRGEWRGVFRINGPANSPPESCGCGWSAMICRACWWCRASPRRPGPGARSTTPSQCSSADDLAVHIVPAQGEIHKECWNIILQHLPGNWNKPDAAIYRQGVARLREGGIVIPDRMVNANWFQADERGFVLVSYFFLPGENPATPDEHEAKAQAASASPGPPPPAYLAGLEKWSDDWTGLLERGAANRLRPEDVEAVASGHKGAITH